MLRMLSCWLCALAGATVARLQGDRERLPLSFRTELLVISVACRRCSSRPAPPSVCATRTSPSPIARAAGVDVTLQVLPDMPHAVPLLQAYLPEGRAALEEVAAYVRGQLAPAR